MQVPGGLGKNVPSPIVELPKSLLGIQVRILDLVRPGLRQVLFAGKLAIIPDHPGFRSGQSSVIVWNAQTRLFEPLSERSNPEKTEKILQEPEPSLPPGDPPEPPFPEQNSDPFYGQENFTQGRDFIDNSGIHHSGSSEEEGREEVQALLELLRWATPNFQNLEAPRQWIQLPVNPESNSLGQCRALFLWNRHSRKIEKACLERRVGDHVRKWWFLTDAYGKWYISHDGEQPGKSRGIDLYL